MKAFEEDFRINGPSVLRTVRTAIKGWKRYRNHAERRIRERFAWEVEGMRSVFAGALWAARRYFRHNAPLAARLDALLKELCAEFGWRARLAAPLVGRFMAWSLAREAKRLEAGWTMEPPTFYERNYESCSGGRKVDVAKWVCAMETEVAAVASL
jgi:hypothetical protein